MSTPPKQVASGQPTTPSTGDSKTGDSKTGGGDDNNKFKQFEGEGVIFKAKLVGTELVMEPRGDKMCQNSIKRLKAIIKGQKSHKKRIVMKISYLGVKIYDEKTNEILHFHEVPQISFIASDDTDARTFGYVCDVPSKAHQFICFKTTGPAAQVMSVISQLFEAVLEKKKDSTGQKSSEISNNSGSSGKLISSESPTPPTLVSSEKRPADIGGSGDSNKSTKAALTKVSSFIDDFDEQFDWAKPEPTEPANFSVQPKPQLNSSLSAISQQLKGLGGGSLDDSPTAVQFDLISGSVGGGDGGSRSGGGDSGIIDSPSSAFSEWCDLSLSKDSSSSMAQPPPLGRHHQHPTAILRQSSLQQQHQPQQQQAGATGTTTTTTNQNRSLIYNYSSVSLNDAALTRQSSFASGQSGLHSDKYAVFNDIDNLPSIFESTSSLNISTTKLSNPFDDVFFS